jgi:hypothetical protein
LSEGVVRHIIEGLVGTGAAIEFEGFTRWTDQLPNIEKMLAGEEPVFIPDRADQKFGLVSAMVHHILEEPDLLGIINGIFDILLAFSNDWCQMAYHDLELTLTGRHRLDDLALIKTHLRHEEILDKLLGQNVPEEVVAE